MFFRVGLRKYWRVSLIDEYLLEMKGAVTYENKYLLYAMIDWAVHIYKQSTKSLFNYIIIPESLTIIQINFFI